MTQPETALGHHRGPNRMEETHKDAAVLWFIIFEFIGFNTSIACFVFVDVQEAEFFTEAGLAVLGFA